MSIDRGMDKEDVVHIYWPTQYNGILLGHKKEWNNAICSNMDGPRDCHMWYQIYVESKKGCKWIYLQNRNRITDIENNLLVIKGEREGRDKLGDWLTYTHYYI